jgi:hypothetical protein
MKCELMRQAEAKGAQRWMGTVAVHRQRRFVSEFCRATNGRFFKLTSCANPQEGKAAAKAKALSLSLLSIHKQLSCHCQSASP